MELQHVELDFIDEYVEVMSPIALALDRLQGEKSESMAYMGALIPTLLTVKQKLIELTQSPNLRYCSPMASTLLAGLDRRFGHITNLESSANDYIIAAISHPYFKLRWVPPQFVEQCRLLFTRVRVINSSDTRTDQPASSSANVDADERTSDDEFFSFLTGASKPSSGATYDSKIQVSVIKYCLHLI